MDDKYEILNAKDFVKQGKWFRDKYRRFVLFRGVNIGSRSKLYPYLPIFPLQNASPSLENLMEEVEKVTPQIDILASLGFNIVRLLVMWKAIEPYPNTDLDNLLPEGKQYLTLVNHIINKLCSKGLFTIIDFHQDLAHELYDGDGFPDWALAIDLLHEKPLEPINLKDRYWSIQYNINYLVRHTLQSFWKNDLTNIEMRLKNYPVRTHLEKTIGQTVKFFKTIHGTDDHPAILGYSPFHEPHQVGFDKKSFEEKMESKFQQILLKINVEKLGASQ